jgi:Lon protease-like protein
VQIEIPSKVPAMILPNVTLFPGMMLPLYVFEPRYRKMLADVLEGSRMFAVAMLDPFQGPEELPVDVGCLGLVRACVNNDDGTSNLFLQGIVRVIVNGTDHEAGYPLLAVEPVAPPLEPSIKSEALAIKVKELVNERYGNADGEPPAALPPQLPDVRRQLADAIASVDSPAQLADMVTYALIPDPARKQEMLETLSTEDRLDKLIHFLLE